jgi:hypothetical protein
MDEFKNVAPKVGELLFRNKKKSGEESGYESLLLVDTVPKDGDRGWYYSQIALIDYDSDPTEVYLGIEAGGGLSYEGLRRATDEDIKKFVEKLISDGEEAVSILSEWIKNIKQMDNPETKAMGVSGLNNEDLERLISLIKTSLKDSEKIKEVEEFEKKISS